MENDASQNTRNTPSIDLEMFPNRFAPENKKLQFQKNVNFIFGKNGTGKTTITDTIREQMSSSYQVFIFDGYERILGENKRLDAVALGKENAEIQPKIDIINTEIEDIKKNIALPGDGSENAYTKFYKTDKDHREHLEKIEKFFSDSAQKIKNYTSPQIAKPTYDKTALRAEIQEAKILSEDEIKKYKDVIKEDKKADVIKVSFPEINLIGHQKAVNVILQSKVSQQQIIAELQDNVDKQNFAREGMRIHEHESNEKCAFCGNEIQNSRWELLGNYFNDNVKKLESDIDNEIVNLDTEIEKLDSVGEVSKESFYSGFVSDIENCNLRIKTTVVESKGFLENLKKSLEDKKKNLFTESQEMISAIPNDFSSIEAVISGIVDNNNEFSRVLDEKQESAKKALRFHEIENELNSFNYHEKNERLLVLKAEKDIAEQLLKEISDNLIKKEKEKDDLISQTKDEEKIALDINSRLQSMGTNSFSLKLVSNPENQKGQYHIKRWYHKEGQFDDIINLSKGEKNIIAFLYFILSLEKVGTDNTKQKIIVLDDPMTSNDDTMQYLMISEIQNFYRKIEKDDFFILLTHNCHFYLNVRPNTATKYKHGGLEISFYEKYGNYRMFSDGKLTEIKYVENGKDDFKTNYELLWKEIRFLHDSESASVDIMLNPFRRICETYMKFNSISADKFFENNFGIKKLYDVNQHSIDDLEAEQNGKTKQDIKDMLKKLFDSNGAGEHFSAYWSG